MGNHRAATDSPKFARLTGRGVMTAATALALTAGPAAGLAMAGEYDGYSKDYDKSDYDYDKSDYDKDDKDYDKKDRDHKDRDHKDRDHKDRDHKDRDHKDRDHKDRDHKDRDNRDGGLLDLDSLLGGGGSSVPSTPSL